MCFHVFFLPSSSSSFSFLPSFSSPAYYKKRFYVLRVMVAWYLVHSDVTVLDQCKVILCYYISMICYDIKLYYATLLCYFVLCYTIIVFYCDILNDVYIFSFLFFFLYHITFSCISFIFSRL